MLQSDMIIHHEDNNLSILNHFPQSWKANSSDSMYIC